MAAAGLRRGGAAGRSPPPCLPRRLRLFVPSPPPAPRRSAPTLPGRGRPACHQRAPIDRRRLPLTEPRRPHLPPASTTAQKEGGNERRAAAGRRGAGRGARGGAEWGGGRPRGAQWLRLSGKGGAGGGTAGPRRNARHAGFAPLRTPRNSPVCSGRADLCVTPHHHPPETARLAAAASAIDTAGLNPRVFVH